MQSLVLLLSTKPIKIYLASDFMSNNTIQFHRKLDKVSMTNACVPWETSFYENWKPLIGVVVVRHRYRKWGTMRKSFLLYEAKYIGRSFRSRTSYKNYCNLTKPFYGVRHQNSNSSVQVLNFCVEYLSSSAELLIKFDVLWTICFSFFLSSRVFTKRDKMMNGLTNTFSVPIRWSISLYTLLRP